MSLKAAAEVVKHSAVESAETVHPAQAAQVSLVLRSIVLTDYIEYNMLEINVRLPATTLHVSSGLKEQSLHRALFLPLYS